MTGRDHPENLGRIDKADSDGRVNGLEEGKTMEIGVRGVDSPDPVLLHEDCRLGVIEEVAAQERRLFHDNGRDLGVPLRRHEKAEGGRSEERLNITPGLRNCPGMTEHAWVGDHTEELVQDPPRRIPGSGLPPPFLDPLSAAQVERRVLISRIDENIGIDNKHYRPSMA